VNALANAEVGDYFQKNFIATYQRVGTFKIVGNQKKGGNVASYFCLPDKRVVHLVAGPVAAGKLLQEARWAVELTKHVDLATRNNYQSQAAIRKAHLDRLRVEYGYNPMMVGAMNYATDPRSMQKAVQHQLQALNRLDKQGKVHQLLSTSSASDLGSVYHYVFEHILKEDVSTLPVSQR
jgi:hypothetical protein